VKRLFGVSKAGHTGTLDPLATGVLPVLVGRGVKASEYMLSSDKHYKATLLLGKTSDTEDITGNIEEISDTPPSRDAVFEAISSMQGHSRQTPPMYSALKIGGKKLCDLAREGVTVEREARDIVIHKIEAEYINDFEYSIDVHCSKGTYIRTLCADIGKKLGCGGAMAALRRVETGEFSLANSVTLEQLEAMDEEARYALLMPIEALFNDLPAVKLPAFYEKLCRSGCEIYRKKISVDLPLGARVRLCDAKGQFFALGEVREYPDGPAVKPLKQFDI
jgi:tRNA pseudouridine55 synthase